MGLGAFSPLATLAAPVSSYTDTTVVPGDYSYRIRVIDPIGPSAYSNVASVTVPKPGSTTVVVGGPNPSFVGQSVTFTATVDSTLASGTPTGSVVFTANGVVTSVPLDAAGQATLTTALLPAGTHTVTADYGGDATFLPSTGSVDQVVNQGSTSVLLTSNNNPSVNGENVKFTATVSTVGGFGSATGNVEFFDGAGSLGVVPLAGNSAIFSTATLTVGTHPITAQYLGDTNFAGSTSLAVDQVVDPGTVSVGLATDGTPSIVGSNVTFTATVAALTGAGTPVGSVQFLDGAVNLGSSPLVGGTANFSTTSLAIGSHDITAVFVSGDVNFTNATSAIVTQVVDPAVTTTSLTSDINPSLYGVQVTFTATVSPPSRWRLRRVLRRSDKPRHEPAGWWSRHLPVGKPRCR